MVFNGLQQFWYHIARKDRMHFDVLLLLCQITESPTFEMFELIGFRRSTLSNFVTMSA